jgi:hypothetical protein
MKRGYYKVEDKIFYSKVKALQEGTRLNFHPTWDFNDHVFDKLDWSVPIKQSIETLYKERALQIRETYDHVIVLFSGGVDSTTVLESFLKNHIPVDEVFIYWPFKAIQKGNFYNPNNKDIDGSNILSEWTYSIEPKLKFIKKYHPNVKITIADYTDNLFQEFTDDLYNLSGHNVMAGYFMRQRVLKQIAATNISDNKKVALIAGIDKPKLHIDEKERAIYGYFVDIPCNSQRPSDDANKIIELFYWTPDMPELPIKACQLVASHITKHTDFVKYFKNEYVDSLHGNETSRSIITSLLYKDWDNNTFQVGKSLSDIYPEHDAWIHKNFSNSLYIQSWQSNVELHLNDIDKKYFKYNKIGQRIGFVGFITKMHKICNY